MTNAEMIICWIIAIFTLLTTHPNDPIIQHGREWDFTYFCGAIFDILVPRFVTSEQEAVVTVISISDENSLDLKTGDEYNAVVTIRYFSLFGYPLRIRQVGKIQLGDACSQ